MDKAHGFKCSTSGVKIFLCLNVKKIHDMKKPYTHLEKPVGPLGISMFQLIIFKQFKMI